jgi:hypothetical protein
MTDPPPTLMSNYYYMFASREHGGNYVRKEVGKVVFACPRDSVTPAVFRGLCDDTVVDFERKIGLGLETFNGLGEVEPRKP